MWRHAEVRSITASDEMATLGVLSKGKDKRLA